MEEAPAFRGSEERGSKERSHVGVSGDQDRLSCELVLEGMLSFPGQS